ncbi:MAG: PQQ-dependent sugar dehydrogenase [Acidobacteria bacterium]|nr:PQQ-dependent sugar dehydrogenase [Acidobacteriota bacterium]
MRRIAIVSTLGLCVACGGEPPASDESAAPTGPSFTSRVVATGLGFPWEVTWGPDGHLWVTERAGKRIVHVRPQDGSSRVLHEFPDAYQAVLQDGVLGMALHPELLQGSGRDYVYVAWNYDGDPSDGVDVRARIQRLTYDATNGSLGDTVDVISGLPAHDDHLGGRLVFGPDEKLYFSIGDQGANWQRNRCNPNLAQVVPSAQDVAAEDWSTYAGTILRLNLDGSIPDDNPTIDGVRSHVFSYGHRNPQGLVFDASGRLFEAEHGPSTDDEVNRIEAGQTYGWPEVAGFQDDQAYVYANWSASAPTACVELGNPRDPPDSVPTQAESAWHHEAFTPPLATFFTVPNDYDFAANGAATVAAAGLDIYTYTDGVPGWADSLLLASLTRGAVYRLTLSPDHSRVVGEPTAEFTSTNRYRDLAIRPDGRAFYLATDNEGPTRNGAGESTRDLANPGAIIEFRYDGTP